MSYIHGGEAFRYPWYMRIILFLQRRRHGRALEPVRLWGRVPQAYLGMAVMYRALDRKASPIDPELRSLIQVLISRINSCDFCIDLNSYTGLERGTTPEKLECLQTFEQSPLFSEREKAALRYATSVTRSGRNIDANIISNLRQHFGDQGMVELAALIAFQNMSSKFNAALGIAAHGFCEIRAGRNPNS